MITALLALVLALGPDRAQDQAPARRGNCVLMTYEVLDLFGLPVPKEGERTTVPESSREFLTDIIKRNAQPPIEDPQATVRITPSGTLVAHVTVTQHEWIREFLVRNGNRVERCSRRLSFTKLLPPTE